MGDRTIGNCVSGKLEGRLENGLHVFRGIPYAAPPVGPRRWLPPQPVEPWTGVRPATDFGNACPQEKEAPAGNPVIDGLTRVSEPHSEDCLYLNVWTPGLDDAKRPVLVWIHLGGWEKGAGSQSNYDGSTLARRGDAVIVTINFRLGAFGFLNLNEITGGRIPSTGNEGSLDQIAALQWVGDNISAFGGDPGNVTIIGESSGSVHCAVLLASPLAEGLFHRAILQSSAGHTAHSLESAERVSRLFLEGLEIDPADVDAMRSLSAEQLVAASTALPRWMLTDDPGGGIMHYHPVIDGVLLHERPIDAIRNGASSDVPLMVGSNLDEHRLAMAAAVTYIAADKPVTPAMEESQVLAMLGFVPPDGRQRLVDTYRTARQRRGQPAEPRDILMAVETDRVLRMPKIKLLEAKRSHRQPAYGYLVTWNSPVLGGILGAPHAIEVGFLFGTYDDTFCGTGPDADALAMRIQDAWLAFAHTGDPSCDSIGQWPTYGEDRETMILDKSCEVVKAPFDDERQVWEDTPGVAFGLM